MPGLACPEDTCPLTAHLLPFTSLVASVCFQIHLTHLNCIFLPRCCQKRSRSLLDPHRWLEITVVHHSVRKPVPQPAGKTPVPRPSGEERSRNGHNIQKCDMLPVDVWYRFDQAPETHLCLETRQICSHFHCFLLMLLPTVSSEAKEAKPVLVRLMTGILHCSFVYANPSLNAANFHTYV